MMGVRTGLDFFKWTGDLVPRQKIDFKITNSEFDTFIYAMALEGMKNSKIIIGEKNRGNVFRNNDQIGGIWEGRNLEVSVEGNIFNVPELSNGLDLDDYWYYPGILKSELPTKAMIFNIQNNAFNLVHSEYGLWLRNLRRRDYPDEPAILFQVRNNQFTMTDGYPWGVYGIRTKGSVTCNNKFSGYGDIALVFTTSEGGLILGNNFSDAEFATAAIYLYPTTSDFTMAGIIPDGSVIDLGINNKIVDMKGNHQDKRFNHRFDGNHQEVQLDHRFDNKHWDMHGKRNH